MKSNKINTLADLIKGDYVLFVTWQICKATPAKIKKVGISSIIKPTYLSEYSYGVNGNGLPKEWTPKRWIFHGYGVWDLRTIQWGDELYFSGRVKHKIFHLSQLEEAKAFADTEVPKLQLKCVMERIDKIKQNFTNKITEMENLEKILTANCNAVSN